VDCSLNESLGRQSLSLFLPAEAVLSCGSLALNAHSLFFSLLLGSIFRFHQTYLPFQCCYTCLSNAVPSFILRLRQSQIHFASCSFDWRRYRWDHPYHTSNQCHQSSMSYDTRHSFSCQFRSIHDLSDYLLQSFGVHHQHPGLDCCNSYCFRQRRL